MGLYVKRDEQRSKLQENIAAELRAKAKANADLENKQIDGVEDSGFIENTRHSSPLLGVWLVLLVFVIAAVIYLIVRSS